MIIVSQDKDKVVNFGNVGNINIEKCYNERLKQEDFTYDILVYIISSGLVRLGKYKTEERAKEVLQEIIHYFSINRLNGSYEQNDLQIKLTKIARYEMPEE